MDRYACGATWPDHTLQGMGEKERFNRLSHPPFHGQATPKHSRVWEPTSVLPRPASRARPSSARRLRPISILHSPSSRCSSAFSSRITSTSSFGQPGEGPSPGGSLPEGGSLPLPACVFSVPMGRAPLVRSTRIRSFSCSTTSGCTARAGSAASVGDMTLQNLNRFEFLPNWSMFFFCTGCQDNLPIEIEEVCD